MKRDSCAGLEWQCKSRKASLCNASNRRKCSANPKLKQVHCRFPQKLQCKSQIKAGALSLSPESAVQITNQSRCTAHSSRKCSTNPQIKQVHCRFPQKVQCKSQIKAGALHIQAESAVQIRKLSKCTVAFPRKCSANHKSKQVYCTFKPKVQCKSKIKASALSLSSEVAVQITNQSKCTAKVRRKCSTEPGNKQVHCTCKPEVQYRTRKISKCTARASRKCITDPRNQATAMHYPAQSLIHAASTASRRQRSSPPRTR